MWPAGRSWGVSEAALGWPQGYSLPMGAVNLILKALRAALGEVWRASFFPEFPRGEPQGACRVWVIPDHSRTTTYTTEHMCAGMVSVPISFARQLKWGSIYLLDGSCSDEGWWASWFYVLFVYLRFTEYLPWAKSIPSVLLWTRKPSPEAAFTSLC